LKPQQVGTKRQGGRERRTKNTISDHEDSNADEKDDVNDIGRHCQSSWQQLNDKQDVHNSAATVGNKYDRKQRVNNYKDDLMVDVDNTNEREDECDGDKVIGKPNNYFAIARPRGQEPRSIE
jgi:hypothetical protein